MSFRERGAWISLLTMLCVWGYYFARAVPTAFAGGDGTWQIALFVECASFSVVIQIMLTLGAAVMAPRDRLPRADERDERIQARAMKLAYFTLLGVVACAVAAVPFVIGVSVPLDGYQVEVLPKRGGAATLLVSAVLLAIVIAEIVRASATLAFYRLGRAV